MIASMGREYVRECERKLIARIGRCAVATLHLIKTGASIPPLNRLFIATPIGGANDLEQVIGRIRRKCAKKKDAKVFHVVDMEIPLCKRHYFRRAVPFYRDKLRIPRFKNLFVG